MQPGLKGPLPWDLAVFLIVTVVGFGYTVQNFARKHFSRSAFAAIPAGPEGFVDLGCLERKATSEKIVTENGPIRLRGRVCDVRHSAWREVDGVRVRNLATGHEATVYFRGNDTSFVTDAITMGQGRNTIQVEWRPSGERTARVVTAEVFEGRREAR